MVDKKWDKVTFADVISKIVGGGTPSKANPKFWGGNIPWASVKDMKDGCYRLQETEDTITTLGLNNSATNLIPKGTVIISTRMGLGRCFKTEIDVAINQDLKALFPNQKIDNNFLLWLYVSKAKEIANLGSGTTVNGIRLEQLKAIDFYLPPLPTLSRVGIL